ncbi:hypothetical protein SPRG_18035, partial [Saprolegnia parasitica CBS 223.65]
MAIFESIRYLPTHELRKYFHYPLKEAAARLHSYEGAVIRLCRQRGFPKWPYRQLAKLSRKMRFLDNVIAKMEDGPTVQVAARRAQLKAQYNAIMYWDPKTSRTSFTALISTTDSESDDASSYDDASSSCCDKATKSHEPCKMAISFILHL